MDVGHACSRVTPVVDGYLLRYGSVRSGRGGRWLGHVQQCVLEGVSYGGASDGGLVNEWNGWGVGKRPNSGVPPCQPQGVLPRYLLRSYSQLQNQEKKLKLLKQTPFHSMTIHEVMYEMMTSTHVLPLASVEDLSQEMGDGMGASAPFCGYGSKDENDGDDKLGININEEEGKKEDENEIIDGEDDSTEEPCYFLPDGTRVNLVQTRAGRDLCRLPVCHISSVDGLTLILVRRFLFIVLKKCIFVDA